MNGQNYLDDWGKQLEEADRQSLAGQWGEFADEFTEFWSLITEDILKLAESSVSAMKKWWYG